MRSAPSWDGARSWATSIAASATGDAPAKRASQRSLHAMWSTARARSPAMAPSAVAGAAHTGAKPGTSRAAGAATPGAPEAGAPAPGATSSMARSAGANGGGTGDGEPA